jgi:hypothetical protein
MPFRNLNDCTYPDEADVETEWQISRTPGFSENDLVLHFRSYITSLPSIVVPNFILETETDYYWRARYHDSVGSRSAWSYPFSFTTTDVSDLNGDGIPYDQEIDNQVDLDGNGEPDINQADIKCVNTVVGGGQIAVKAISTNIVSVDSVRAIDPSEIPDGFNMPDEFILGLVSFKVTVQNAGEPAEVALYFSETFPNGAKFYKYDPVYGLREYPYADIYTPSSGNAYVILQLRDGDPELGDVDGLANTFIFDPGGVGLSATPSIPAAPGSGGGGGGCFIDTLLE